MNLEIRHYGIVKNRKLVYNDPALYNHVVEALEGQEFTLTLKKKHKSVSTNQYGYYRGGILNVCYQSEMFRHLDNKDEIHELYFAPMFLSYVVLRVIGGQKKEIKSVRSLTDLSREEMTEFIDRVIAHCSELGIEILEPEMYYQKYYNK